MLKRTRMVGLAMLLALVAVIATAVTVFAGVKPNAGTADVDIVAANPSDSTTAAVIIQYYSTDGTAGPSRNDTIDPLEAKEYAADDAGFSGSFQGVAVVSSNSPLGVVARTKWSGGETTDGVKYGEYAGVTAPSDVLYYPNCVYDPRGGGSQNTILSIQNTGGSDVTAYVNWTNLGGVRDFQYAVTVPANGSIVMETSNWDTAMADNVPNLTSTSFYSTWGFWSGGVVVTSTQSSLAGAGYVTFKQYAASYAAVSSGATRLFYPSIERREYNVKNNGLFGGGTSRWAGLSAIAVTNLDLTTSGVVTFTFVDSLGIIGNKVFTAPLAAGGTLRMNTHSGMKIGTVWYYDHDDLKVLDRYPTNASTREWVGSVIVESSGPEIVGTCNTLYLNDSKSDLYEATPAGGGYYTLLTPEVYRVTATSVPASQRHFTLLRIQNTAAVTATIDAHFYDRDGNDKLQLVDYPLSGEAVATPNMMRTCFGDGSTGCTKPWEAYLGGTGLGNNYKGWILFTSDEPIAVTIENWYGGNSHVGMGAYDGIGID